MYDFCVVGYPAGKRVHITPTVDRSEIRHPPAEGTVGHPIIYKVLYIPGGCLGFLPSTVSHSWKRKLSSSRLPFNRFFLSFPGGYMIMCLKMTPNVHPPNNRRLGKLVGLLKFIGHPKYIDIDVVFFGREN